MSDEWPLPTSATLSVVRTGVPFPPSLRSRHTSLGPASSPSMRLYKPTPVLTALLDINKRNSDHRSRANSEQKWEPHPVILSIVDDCLDDVGADYG